MIVLRHLATVYRSVYLWFWAVMGLFISAIALSFVIFGPYLKHVMEGTIWQGGGQQAPRWFLFVIGIMLATVNLPVIIANGITRRSYFAGATVFSIISAALFALAVMAGFAIERAAFQIHGMQGYLPTRYPLTNLELATAYAGEAFLGMACFMLSGWIMGLTFYRLRVWVAIVLIPVAAIPLGAVSLPPGSEVGAELATRMALAVGALAVGLLMSYGVARSVPVRPKKA